MGGRDTHEKRVTRCKVPCHEGSGWLICCRAAWWSPLGTRGAVSLCELQPRGSRGGVEAGGNVGFSCKGQPI